MNFAKRLKLFGFGFLISFIFLIFIFGDRMFSWSYFPNDRVLAEIKIRDLDFSPQAIHYLKEKNITEKFIVDTALIKGEINFKESNAQAKPCPTYILYYENLKIKFTKCEKKVIIDSLF